MLLSAFLLPTLVCGTAFFINFIAIYYHASRAIPFGTMVSVKESYVTKVKISQLRINAAHTGAIFMLPKGRAYSHCFVCLSVGSYFSSTPGPNWIKLHI